jgi:hypothetical protein
VTLAAVLALVLIQLTGPDGQAILLDRDKITTLRSPRSTEYFAPGTHCLVFTVDGKNVNVTETCEQVRKMLEGASQ